MKPFHEEASHAPLGSRLAAANDQFGTAIPFLDQLRHAFRRVLHIRIEENDRITVRMIQSCAESSLLAEIPREFDKLRIAEFPLQIDRQLGGVVAAAIIHRNPLPLDRRVLKHRTQAPRELRQKFLLVP